jgi:peptidyl-prolyl cis-trans isomerase D
MMQGLRNAGQTWLGKTLIAILFGVLILSFAIWGIGDIFRGGARNTVATVGKTEIGLEAVRSAYQNEVQRLSRRFRQNITPEQARAIGVDQQVLSRLITEAAMDNETQALGLSVGDATVAQAIFDDANFRGSSGQFDRALFNELLRQNGMNEPMYVREQRGAMARNQLGETIAGALAAPLAVQEAAHRYRAEQRVLSFFEVPAAAAGEVADPADDVLRRFYEDRRTGFRAPETRIARVLALTPAALADPASVSDVDAQAHYERIKNRFGAPERRTIQQIVFPNQADAAAARERLRAGLGFDALAAERNVSAADLALSSFTRAEMLDQAIATAAFGLAQDVVSEPVQGAFGYALLRVTGIDPERVRPFSEVAAEVRADLATSRATQRIREVHDKIEDMRASARPLQEIAAELKLPLTEFGPVDRARQGADGAALPAVPAAEQLVEAMFRADIGTDNEAVRTRDNGYVWYDVTTINVARERTFDEVKASVLTQWRQDEVASRLQVRTRELADRIRKGETVEAVASSIGAEVKTSPALTRESSLPEFPANLLTVAFGTKVNEVDSAALAGDRGRILFRVISATVPPFIRTTQDAENVAQQLGVAIGDELLSQYVSAAQSRLGVRINQQVFRNATGGGDS